MRKKKVSFIAKKPIPVCKRVRFVTSKGKRVSFRARKKIKKPVRVQFYSKK